MAWINVIYYDITFIEKFNLLLITRKYVLAYLIDITGKNILRFFLVLKQIFMNNENFHHELKRIS